MRSSSIIDLSHAIDDDVPVYPGDPSFHCRQTSRVPDNGWSVHELKFSSHVGTHIDAPSHRFEGKSSIDAISLSSFVRPALVIDVSGKDAGSSIDLVDFQPHESKVKEGMAVLFRTGWDQSWTDKPGKYFEHPYIKRAVAERLVDLGVAIIGVDTMSPDPISEADDELGVHDVVLGAGRLIAENLTNLAALQTAQDNAPDRTPMVCLAPLKFVGCDGSPHGVSLPRRFTFNSCRKTPPVTKQLPGLFIVALTRVCGMIPRPALPSLLPEHKSATIGWFKRLPQFSPELPTPMRTIIDLSHLLSSSGGSFCDGHPRYACEPCCTIESDGSAVSRLSLSSHTGTHIDAPAHFIPGGSSVDAIDLSQLVCPAVIIDARGYDPNSYLDWDDTFAPYEEQFKPGVAVLVCTGWSRHWNTTIYSRNPRIAVDTARRIADRGVRVLGIDALSPDGIPEKSEVVKHEVHLEWLGRGGAIAENLSNLETLLEDGSARWMVSLLPLRLDRCDGSPIRAVAWRE